ncbi:hypothetical protein Ancab_016203 [Ancistrocladus abbreviatus]
MDLRSNNHLHFISAIRHGEVIKVLNRTRGKPTLVFRTIRDIYDSDVRAFSKSPKKANRSLGEFFDGVKLKIETMEEQKPVGNDQQNNDLDDLSFSKLTLRELKETCKARKRKASRPINVSEESLVTCPVVKQECIDQQPEEDKLDLGETLSSWKFKLSKDKKKRKFVTGSLKSSAVACRSVEISDDKDNQQYNRDIHVPTSTKIEVSEYDYSRRQNLKSPMDDYSSVSKNQVISSEKTANGVVATDEGKPSKLEWFSVSEACQGCSFTKVSGEVAGTDGSTQKPGCLSNVEESGDCKHIQVSYKHLEDEFSLDDYSSVSDHQWVSFKKIRYGIMETDDNSPSKLESLSVSEASQGSNCTEVSDKVPRTDDGCTQKLNFLPQCCSFSEVSNGVPQNDGGFTRKLNPFSNLEESIGCKLNQVSYKHLEDEILLDVDSSTSNHLGVSSENIINGIFEINGGSHSKLESLSVSEASQGCSCTEASDEGPGTDDGCAQNLDSLSNLEDSEGCKLNQISFKHLEDAEKSSLLGTSESKEFVRLDDTATTGDKFLVVPAVSLMQGEDIADIMTLEAPDTSSVLHDNSDYDKSIDSSHVHGLPVLVDRSVDVHAHCTSIQSVEPSKRGEVSQLPDDNDEYVLLDFPTEGVNNSVSVSSSALNFCESLNTVDVVASEDYDTPVTMTQGRKSSTCEPHNAPGLYYPDGHPSEAKDEVFRSSSNEIFDHQKWTHPPERLFSARKTISPISQERLSRLVNSTELHNKSENPKLGKQLCYENRCHNSASLEKSDPEGAEVIITPRKPECTNEAEMTSNTGKAIRKGTDEKCLRSKCSPKVPQLTHVLPRLNSGCSSIQSCSQSAISFSQQQMHDIERLATKLTKQLHSMKEIAVGILHSETRTGTTGYNINEVRVAIEHATKIEETTRKWLSMMQRDCNRFCKIMSLAEKDASNQENTIHKDNAEKKAASPGNMAQKERKITFADEAGGRLCHVRFYEESINSALDSQLENGELMAT